MAIKLTFDAVQRLPSGTGQQRLFWCSERHGLGVRCSAVSHAKSWIAQLGRSKRYTLGSTSILNPEEAWRFAKPILSEILAGRDPKAEQKRVRLVGITVGELLAAYLAQDRLAPLTRLNYRKLADRHLAEWMQRPLHSITADMVEARFAEITRDIAARKVTGKITGGVNVDGRASANAALKLFRALWAYQAERDESLPPSPVRRLRKAWHRLERRDRRLWDQDLPIFHQAVLSLPSRLQQDVVLLTLYTGMREGEVIGLRWDEVDFGHKVLNLPPGRMKGRRTFTLPMNSVVHDILVRRRALTRGDFVFPGANSQSGHYESLGYVLDQVKKVTRLQVSCHDLRRTFISIAAGCAIPHAALKMLVAHSTGADVTSGYIHLSVDELRQAAQVVADKISLLCAVEAPESANVARLG
jgi:integrase